VIAAAQHPFPTVTPLRLFDGEDTPWVERVLDVVERSLGEPWRVLLERLEHAPLRASSARVMAIVGALRRITGGRAERGKLARKLRGAVLGRPALDRDARDARLAAASAELGLEPRDLESLLWADLALERPVVLPQGRPPARTLIAFANVERIQRCVRRANELELRVWDDANSLVRMAARCGLIASIARGEDDSTLLALTGPLGLFHATSVYGRALSALVPLLADHRRFRLDVHADLASGRRTLRVEPPVVLPPVPAPRRKQPSLAERLARALVDAGCTVEREPSPTASGAHLLFPDLAFVRDGERTLVEIVGFSTQPYLAEKLARYRAADASVVLCVDAGRAPPDLAHDDRAIVPFTRRIDAAAVLEAREVAPC